MNHVADTIQNLHTINEIRKRRRIVLNVDGHCAMVSDAMVHCSIFRTILELCKGFNDHGHRMFKCPLLEQGPNSHIDIQVLRGPPSLRPDTFPAGDLDFGQLSKSPRVPTISQAFILFCPMSS